MTFMQKMQYMQNFNIPIADLKHEENKRTCSNKLATKKLSPWQ